MAVPNILKALDRLKPEAEVAELTTAATEGVAYQSIILDDVGYPSLPCLTCGCLTFWRTSSTTAWHCRDCTGELPELVTGMVWYALPSHLP